MIIKNKDATIPKKKEFDLNESKNKNKWLKSSKLIVPVYPYKKIIPINTKNEENEPIIKYFNPDSIEYILYLFIDAIIYRHRLINSKQINNNNKLIKLIKNIIHIKQIDNINIYSIFSNCILKL